MFWKEGTWQVNEVILNSRQDSKEVGSRILDVAYYGVERREMLAFVPASANRFLELGCGVGAFGALLRAGRTSSHVIGVEVHPAAASVARGKLDEVLEMTAEDAVQAVPTSCVDCVICNDILEHLVDPWTTLVQMRRLLVPGGHVVASIPNVRHFPVFKDYFIGGDWKYEKWGVMDKAHLRFFTKTSIGRMFVETGYVVERIEGIFGESLPWKVAVLNAALGGKLDDMKYQRFACVARIDAEIDSALPKIPL